MFKQLFVSELTNEQLLMGIENIYSLEDVLVIDVARKTEYAIRAEYGRRKHNHEKLMDRKPK